MGCAGSRFDELPVTGHKKKLAVIPINGEVCDTYLSPETTVLKLREKLLSFSGDDCSIKVKIYERKTCLISYFLFPRQQLYNTFATYFLGSEW